MLQDRTRDTSTVSQRLTLSVGSEVAVDERAGIVELDDGVPVLGVHQRRFERRPQHQFLQRIAVGVPAEVHVGFAPSAAVGHSGKVASNVQDSVRIVNRLKWFFSRIFFICRKYPTLKEKSSS